MNEVMIGSRIKFAIPVYVIILGVSWLLDVMNVIPGISWIRTVGLGASGIFILVVWGINNVTFVTGIFLMVTSVCLLMTQAGRLEANKVLPILIIILGGLFLLVPILKIPSSNIFRYTR